VEILIVISIIGTLAAISTTMYVGYLNRARVSVAIQAITALSIELSDYGLNSGTYPQSLNELGYGTILDPWGNPYRYLNIANVKGKGKVRKDRFLVPINSDFDLYSMGKDGDSKPPLRARKSKDDVIRANDGQYIGIAAGF
jgi:general secretion pathway protein G